MAKTIKIGGRLESVETGNIVAGANQIIDDDKNKKQSVINGEVDAELVRLDETKQGNLTFDNAPTENSNNPVKSGGVYAADKLLSDAIEAILLLIPSAASALNKLVDMATMNSSIATATASFKGTYNLVSDLHLAVDATHSQIGAALDALSLDADNNDYAFVQVPNSATDPTEIKKTERYKFNGTAWAYEYDLNNSGFTSAQWAAINSAITAALVTKLTELPTNSELVQALAGKQDNLTFDNVPTAGSNNPVKSGGVYTRNNEIVALINALDEAKQNILTFDSTPTANSMNPVTSNGIKAAIDLVQAAVVALSSSKQDVLTFDSTPTLGSNNPVTSSGIKTEANRLNGLINDNAAAIVNLNNLYQALTQSAIVVVAPADTWPVTNPNTTTIYRVVDRINTPPQYYSDYMWNGTTMVQMAQYDNAIDDTPTEASNNLVKSGGVDKSIKQAESDSDEFTSRIKFGMEPTNILELGVFEHGSLDNHGQPVASIVMHRARLCNYIPVDGGNIIYIVNDGNYGINIIGYNENMQMVSETGSKTSTTTTKLLESVKFIKAIVRPNPDASTTIPLNEILTHIQVMAVLGSAFTEKQTRIVTLRSVDGNLLEPNYLYRNASIELVKQRLLSEKLYVEPNTSYKIEKLLAYNSTERVAVCFYDKDDGFVKDTAWIDTDAEFRTTNEKYIRILYKYDDTSNMIDVDVVPSYVVRKLNKPVSDVNLTYASTSYWELGTLNDSGEEADSSSRLRTGFIHVDNLIGIDFSIGSGYLLNPFFYDKNKNFLYYRGYNQSLNKYRLRSDVAYMRIVVRKDPDANINLNDIVTANPSVTSSFIGESLLRKLVVGQWNCGAYNYGSSTTGIPNDQLDEKLPEVRELVTKIGADILIVNEQTAYIDRNRTIDTYNAVFKQFYPYYMEGGWRTSLYSKYPISGKYIVSSVGDHREFFDGDININGEVVHLIGVHFTPFDAADRITEATQVATRMNQFEKCILLGDLNTGNNSEDAASQAAQMAPFEAIGCNLGNRGYWGTKATYPDGNLALDNIITKGINIDNFEVIDETSVSDHYPIHSSLSF